ncbi:hypothetical protein [Streptacidiphilus melanogenes]|uniref:hypothetical protein n=1 Tax=Streptacidiphilus melanogenes TaxID=411235 RepID=UPI0005A7EF41|nr:hypothetical protein [Streptacidiphilus melanogenes]
MSRSGNSRACDDWPGGGATPIAATSPTWLVRAGLDVVLEEFVPEGDTGHVLFWARRPEG